MKFGIAIGAFACLPATCGAQEPVERAANLKRFQYTETHMGVPFRMTVYARNRGLANSASAAAFARIESLNRVFSDYSTKSEVAKLRAVKAGQPASVSPDMAMLLGRSLRLSKQTNGAFDVTVGPIVRLWRRCRRTKRLPKPESLERARQRSGYHRVTLSGKRLTLDAEGMRLDFGAIAKGFACDEAIASLTKHGIQSALVDGGGDIRMSDSPPGKDGWQIEIEPEKANTAATMLTLRKCGVATSGDRYRFVEIDGTRYSHIVDPRTGVGLTSRLMVTIIAPNATDADAFASAVSVLGKKEGMRLLESREHTDGLIRDYLATTPTSHRSSGFAQFTVR